MGKEEYWNILNNKCTLAQTMRMFGVTQDEVNKTIEETKQVDVHDSSCYYAISGMFARLAYLKLVELKEIDSTRIFNLANKKYDDEKAMLGDIGLKGEDTYYYMDGTWIN